MCMEIESRKSYNKSRTRIKLFFLLAILVHHSPVFANPTPLGLEVDVTKCDSIKYHTLDQGENPYNYNVLYIDPKETQMEDLKGVLVNCDKDKNTVQLIRMYIERKANKFSELYKSLTEKYKLVYKDIPFVGTSFAEFKDENVKIVLIEEHLGADIKLTYITDSYDDLIRKEDAKEENAKRANNKKLL